MTITNDSTELRILEASSVTPAPGQIDLRWAEEAFRAQPAPRPRPKNHASDQPGRSGPRHRWRDVVALLASTAALIVCLVFFGGGATSTSPLVPSHLSTQVRTPSHTEVTPMHSRASWSVSCRSSEVSGAGHAALPLLLPVFSCLPLQHSQAGTAHATGGSSR